MFTISKMTSRLHTMVLLFSAIIWSSCSGDDSDGTNATTSDATTTETTTTDETTDETTTDESPSFEVPDTYTFTRNGESTVSFSGQTERIAMAEEILSAMKVTATTAPTATALLAMFDHQEGAEDFSDAALNASTKSVKSKVAASADFFSANAVDAAAIKTQFEGYLTDQVNVVLPAANTAASAGVAGQIADGTSTRYVNGDGIEMNQIFAKGLIGGLMADQALNNYLSPDVLDAGTNIADNDAGTVAEGKTYTNMEHKWDEAYGYVYGASADPANPNATIGADDSFMNKYIGRVEDDADFAGIAARIFNAFVTGRAAIVAGNYTARDEQAAIIRKALSEVIAIRAVYYLQQGKNGLNPDDMGPALHDLSEGIGFVVSLQFTRTAADAATPYFTKEVVDGYLATLQEGNGFWDLTGETLDGMSDAIAAPFEFTVAQAGSTE